ncbi:alpha/beta hydrolase [Streptomyces sp. ET3-23]|uniref:alpha/beta hydrolase family protein n=1 Tax=Streptomyces sp. ET3-23 TaxID=2885643 RepID=UPI001D116F73|nr:alpha/beta fold hydrolase [Streptomyces sp. ET3-23]MCC2274044.1 alpha/beta hydrolase [Streptomyces sp. ET3-23]
MSIRSRVRDIVLKLAAGITTVAAASAAACSPGPAGPGHASGRTPGVTVTDQTYAVPRPLPPGQAGALIAATDHGPDRVFAGTRRWTVLYHSADAHGADIPVSGTVLVPGGPPPPGGRPVVSWAHGTTGVADKCAPSHAPNLGFNSYAQELGSMLRAGYAVAATDYPGLGTPGMHTYLVGPDEGNAVVDIVTAARHLTPGLSPTWFAVGHSQGGQAALFAANAARRAPDTRLGGTVAIAPASHLETMLPGVIASHVSTELSFALYSLAGLSATDPSTDLHTLLGPTGSATANQVLNECLKASYQPLSQVTTEATLPLDEAQLAAIGGKMGAYGDPDRAAIGGPVLVVQGADDHDVPPAWTAEVVGHLRALGSPAVADRTYPGAGHDDVLGRSVCDVLSFFAAHGGRPASGCVPFRTDVSDSRARRHAPASRPGAG